MRFNKNSLTVTEAQNPLGQLLGDDATNGSGAVTDGKGGGWTKSLNRREQRENDGDEGEDGGESRRG